MFDFLCLFVCLFVGVGDFGSPRPVAPAPIVEHLAVDLSLPVFKTYEVCRGWDSNTQTSACGTNALTDCATVVVSIIQTYRPRLIHLDERLD